MAYHKSFEEGIKDMYNRDIKEKYIDKYEYKRWFFDKNAETDYVMMRKAVEFAIYDIEFHSCLELGPGPGTWTKVILRKNEKTKILLLDISKEMLKSAKKNLSQYRNIKYKEINFLEYSPKERFDFFFSSRAIEYISDKEKMCDIIKSSLKGGGRGVIITKKPHPVKLGIRKILGGIIENEHLLRISPIQFKKMLEKKGFKNINIYPVIMPPKPPFFNLLSLRVFLFNLFYKRKLNFLTNLLSESYLIKFENDN